MMWLQDIPLQLSYRYEFIQFLSSDSASVYTDDDRKKTSVMCRPICERSHGRCTGSRLPFRQENSSRCQDLRLNYFVCECKRFLHFSFADSMKLRLNRYKSCQSSEGGTRRGLESSSLQNLVDRGTAHNQMADTHKVMWSQESRDMP